MNRAEAAEYIKKRCFAAYPNTDDSLWDKAMVTAIKALEQPEQRWIPVSKRLPEEERKHYWICTDTGYQCECRWTNNRFGMGKSDKWGWSIFDVPQYSHVVAWMPLPEPFREGGAEECH